MTELEMGDLLSGGVRMRVRVTRTAGVYSIQTGRWESRGTAELEVEAGVDVCPWDEDLEDLPVEAREHAIVLHSEAPLVASDGLGRPGDVVTFALAGVKRSWRILHVEEHDVGCKAACVRIWEP